MYKYLFEELTPKQQQILNQFLSRRVEKLLAVELYDSSKDKLIDEIGCESLVILSPTESVQISTAVRETIEWRTAFVNLARIMAADDAEQKEALKGCTNTATATTVKVIGPKKGGKK